MTQETHKTNPVLRLLNILDKAEQVPHLSEHTGGSISVREAWCFIFDIPDCNSEEALLSVLSGMVALRKLFKDAENALRALNANENLFVRPVVNISRIVNLNVLTDSWGACTRYLNTEDMTRLEYAEHLLAQSVTTDENVISNDELKELLIEIDGLIESILESSLLSELKTSLLALLHDIRKAVLEYRIRGAAVLKEALTESIGVLAVNKEALDQNKDSDDIQALGRMLVRIDKMYTFAMKMKPLLEAASNVLPALASHIK